MGSAGLAFAFQLVQRLGRMAAGDLKPRRWSNAELRRFAPHLGGDVANISGWQDADKEGGRYRSYFTRCRSYTITNHAGARGLGDGVDGAVPLNLEAALPDSLHSAFDVVFCHTVLEHVFDKRTAFMNLASMSRDILILVVPFLQGEHYDRGSYGDYWRYTPMSLEKLFSDAGMSLLYLSSNDSPWWSIYLFAVGSRHPGRWRDVLPAGLPGERKIGVWPQAAGTGRTLPPDGRSL
jgi:hypothetical protein